MVTRRSSCCIVFVFRRDPARSSSYAGSCRFERRFSNLERRVRQAQFPPSTVELRSCREYGLRRCHSEATAAAATKPSAIPIKGLSTANQKDTFHSGLSAFRFLFIHLLQVFGGGHFRRVCVLSVFSSGVRLSNQRPEISSARNAAFHRT